MHRFEFVQIERFAFEESKEIFLDCVAQAVALAASFLLSIRWYCLRYAWLLFGIPFGIINPPLVSQYFMLANKWGKFILLRNNILVLLATC